MRQRNRTFPAQDDGASSPSHTHQGDDMQQYQDRDALLEAVRSLREDTERLVAWADANPDAPAGADDTWTFNDAIAHLTSWRLMTAARLEAALHGEEPKKPWPAPLEEEDDLDEINRWFYETNHDKPRAALLRESRETFARVERAIAALPERDLFTVDRFPWLVGDALGPAVVAGTVDHFREHEPELRALARQA
jgi:hypothetical protein